MTLAPLFTPYKIKHLTLKNRFVMSPMQRHKPINCIPDLDMVDYYESRAEGGIGLIVTQGTTMNHPTSKARYAGFFPAAYEGWRRCADAVLKYNTHIWMQLWHPGCALPAPDESVGVSEYSTSGKHMGRRALTTEEIREIIELYGVSAKALKHLGFSGLELHGGHGYLIGQFLSDISNNRTDEFGGSTMAERMTYVKRVLQTIREAVGDEFPIGFRLSQWKDEKGCTPFTTPDELKLYVETLEAYGVDVFNVGTGTYWRQEYPGSEMNLAGWTKKFAKGSVISSGGFGLDDDLQSLMRGRASNSTVDQGFDNLMARFARKEFDLLSLGRTILTDHNYVRKLRDGQFDQIKKVLTFDDVSGIVGLTVRERGPGNTHEAASTPR